MQVMQGWIARAFVLLGALLVSGLFADHAGASWSSVTRAERGMLVGKVIVGIGELEWEPSADGEGRGRGVRERVRRAQGAQAREAAAPLEGREGEPAMDRRILIAIGGLVAGLLVGFLLPASWLFVEEAGTPLQPWERVRLDLDDGVLLFVDVRKFGRFSWHADPTERLGPLGIVVDQAIDYLQRLVVVTAPDEDAGHSGTRREQLFVELVSLLVRIVGSVQRAQHFVRPAVEEMRLGQLGSHFDRTRGTLQRLAGTI